MTDFVQLAMSPAEVWRLEQLIFDGMSFNLENTKEGSNCCLELRSGRL